MIGIDATVGPIGAALSNNMKLGIINGNFIGNSITTSYVTYVGPSDYFGSGYGGAIANQFGTIGAINNSVSIRTVPWR